MPNLIIGIGGTGAKVLEAFVYLVAADLVPKLKDYRDNYIIHIDMDKHSGLRGRLKETIESYEAIRTKLGLFPVKLDYIELGDINHLSGVLTGTAYHDDTAFTLEGILDNDSKPFYQMLFPESILKKDLQQGFYGYASIGTLFFEKVGEFEMLPLVQGAGNRNDIVVIASLHGSTGLSGVASLLEYLADRQAGSDIAVSLVLIGPYFTFETKGGEDRPKDGDHINPDLFKAKANESWKQLRELLSRRLSEKGTLKDLLKVKVTLIEVHDRLWDRYEYHEGGVKQRNPLGLVELFTALRVAERVQGSDEEGKWLLEVPEEGSTDDFLKESLRIGHQFPHDEVDKRLKALLLTLLFSFYWVDERPIGELKEIGEIKGAMMKPLKETYLIDLLPQESYFPDRSYLSLREIRPDEVRAFYVNFISMLRNIWNKMEDVLQGPGRDKLKEKIIGLLLRYGHVGADGQVVTRGFDNLKDLLWNLSVSKINISTPDKLFEGIYRAFYSEL